MKACERLLKYVTVYTDSDETSTSVPTTARQFDLARLLAEELRGLGVQDAAVDDKCYVYAHLPATPGCEARTRIGFIAHLDTAPSFTGKDVKPHIIQNYDGGDVTLGTSGRVLRVSDFPHLAGLRGRTLIVTDGTTLLGADDKAGVAEIMTLVERLQTEKLPHGAISIAFTPDEEVGAGADNFDVDAFGADFAYTLDGDLEGGIEFENFNAAAATFAIKGFDVHPGEAKGVMINALLLATEINALLPAGETPRETAGYEGFYHLTGLEGCTEWAKISYIVRDHDSALFEARQAVLRRIETQMNEKYGAGTVTLTLREQYRNMLEKIKPCYHLIETASEAALAAGITPVIKPIRGGTDGARLSFMGLPCPNLGTGGCAFHGPYEHITVEGMDKAVEMVLGIVKRYAEK